MTKHARMIGTTDSAISKAESEVGFLFPSTFREWLKQNNGKAIEDITIFPVFDERDPRKTWDSIVRNYNSNWRSWLDNYGSDHNFSHLLPIGEFGSGDYFCLDFSSHEKGKEPIVVIWSHESGETESVATNFAHFVELVESDQLEY